MGATNSRGQKRAGELLYSDRSLPAPAVARAEGIVSNNSNTTYNFGRDVINNNWVNNYVCPESTTPDLAKKQEESMKTIKAVLGDRFVQDALHTTQPADGGCMPGTRETVLSKIMTWAKDNPMNIIWLAGMAGTGKTSIALTLCRMLDVDTSVVLGGTFFCSRSAGSIPRTEPRRILPTLAASLACQFPEYAAMLAAQLKEDDGLAYKPVSSQIAPLFIKPFAVLKSISRPIVFIVDALDECNDERELAQLLAVIADLRSDARLKFILTSRPEMYIRGTPISNPSYNNILHLHTLSEEEVECDIRRYVVGTLQVAAPHATWYMNDNIEKLVRLSDGLFIFASTALKYVLDPDNNENREQRLARATSFTATRTAAKTTMDKMYELVLKEAFRDDKVDDDELEGIQRLLACILSARTPLSVEALADLMADTPLKLRNLLRRLHSLVYLPPNDMEPGLRTLHASFGDYVFSRAAAPFRIAASVGDLILAHGCLHVMIKRLHFNVSQSRSSHESNPSTRPDSITLSLEYACLQWIYHISAIPDPPNLDQDIEDVFRLRFLFWLEVVSVLGRMSRAAAMLLLATSTVRSTELSQFLRDAHGFVASSRESIERSAPHIYLSALPFTQKDSLVYQTFAPLCTGLISVDTFGIDHHGGRLVMTFPGHKGTAITYSPDGHLLAAGSYDGTVRIWDMRTGDDIMLLPGDDLPVRAIAFAPDGLRLWVSSDVGNVNVWKISEDRRTSQQLYSNTDIGWPMAVSPDGCLLASAQEDYTVRLRRFTTGQQLSVLRGHTDEVYAIAFSPHHEMLATGSGHGTILLWNSRTGDLVGQITQDRAIRSLCFCPDGTRLSSACGGEIRLWELQTNSTIAVLCGHAEEVVSVQFSPDGKSLLSTAESQELRLWILRDDKTEASSIVLDRKASGAAFSPDGLYIASTSDGHIRVWNTGSFLQTVQPLPAHDDDVLSVAVSLDGVLIASGSRDQTVRLWDVTTGEQKVPPLQGHTDMVLSVTISSDGRFIASGSRDGTVRLWDAQTGVAVGQPLQGHESAVSAVTFAPDAQQIASGSWDQTVRLWAVATRQLSSAAPLFCNGLVDTVAFSPDGRFIAAGDNSGRIHLWQSGNGQLIRKPFSTTSGGIVSIAFSPTGAHIACGGLTGRGDVWNVSTGQEFRVFSDHMWSVASIAFSADGQYIATCQRDRDLGPTVRLWGAATSTLLATLRTHRSSAPSADEQPVALTSDGRFIVSGSQKTIRVWDTEKARSLSSVHACNPVAALASTNLDDGWLLGPARELLMWVPAEYRGYIQVSPCTTLIGQRRVVITADERGLCTGENWTACWLG